MIPIYRPDYDEIYRKMEALTKCNHTRIEPRKKIATNNKITIKKQCLECGLDIGVLKKNTFSEAEISGMPVWNNDLAVMHYEKRNRLHAEMKNAEENRTCELWRIDYKTYLQSPEWKQRRQLVIIRAQGICEGCLTNPAQDVHHTTYAHAGEEFLFELVALCRACHERFHDSVSRPI